MRMREWVTRIATRLAEVVVIAGLSVGTAKLGFLSAVSPGNVTPVWLPSGIALAAMLVVGVRAWVGIWLGSFLTNAVFFTTFQVFSPVAIATSSSIAVGSTLQAWLGAVLIRRFISPDRFPKRIGQILGFIGIEMLVCSLAPTVGTASLYVGGYELLTDAASLWGTWWLRDLVGVLLVAPMALLVSEKPKQKREFTFPLLSAGFALSLLAYYFTRRLELQTMAHVFHASWVVLLAGLTMTLLLAFYLAQRRRVELTLQAALEHGIAERTRQLLASNQALQRQITQRRQLEEELKGKAEELLNSNTELTRREKITQSLLEDLQTSKSSLERQQRFLREAHTNLQRSHEELQTVQLQLIQAEKMESIGRMAAGVAHEVKNPLAVILMGVAYLSKQLTNGDANVPVVLRDMDDAIRRADTVIRGLLDFSTPSELHFNTEDLNAVIEQAFALVKHEFARAHVTVIKDLAASLPSVNLDDNKIQQAFINLLINAAHAMSDGGILTVRTSIRPLAQMRRALSLKDLDRFVRADTVIVAEIEDTGSGIPEGKLDKIFDPFFTTKPPGKGTGLGLTVTKKIIELHGGVIDIRNRAEGGVRATLVFA